MEGVGVPVSALVDLPTAGEWAALWTFLTLLVIGASAYYAKGQVDAARTLHRAQTRPFVVADLDLAGPWWLVDFVLTNVGSTVARDVRIRFTEEPKSTLKEWGFPGSRMVTHGITTFPPGKVITALFENVDQRAHRGDELPSSYDVELTYRDDFGVEYEDTYTLDLGLYMTRESLIRHGEHEIAETLEKLEKSVAGWAHNANGVRVELVDRRRGRRSRRNDRIMEWRERADAGARPALVFFALRRVRRAVTDRCSRLADVLYDLLRD